MRNRAGWAHGHRAFGDQVFKEGFDAIEFATDTLESVFVVFEALLKLFQVIGRDISCFDNVHFT